MPKSITLRAAWVAIAANALLLLLKASATGLSDSLTIFSETLNSLSDVVSSVVIVLCVRWAMVRPDATHPFGHHRAEPIAGLLVSIFTGILGFEVCRTAVLDFWHGELPEQIGPYPIIALCITLALKSWLAVRFHRLGQKLGSPALRATALDCRNDVLICLQGLIAVAVAEYRVPLLDILAAFVVGGYIIYSAHRIGMENLDYLMGRSPDEGLLAKIHDVAESVPGVLGVTDVRAHYVGTMVHVEFAAIVDGAQSTTQSHDVAEAAREAVEAIEPVNRAFVHIAPLSNS